VLAYLDPDGSRATEPPSPGGTSRLSASWSMSWKGSATSNAGGDPCDRRTKLIIPTERGLDQMTRSEAVLAAIERRHAQALGVRAYADFRRAFRRVAHLQRRSREVAACPPATTDRSTAPTPAGVALRLGTHSSAWRRRAVPVDVADLLGR